MASNVKNLPLSVIIAATGGDGKALGTVLAHYQRYIRSLATRTLTDEYGNEYYYVDEEIEKRLEARLIYCIVTDFKILRLKAGIKEVGGAFPFRTPFYLNYRSIKTYSKSGMF